MGQSLIYIQFKGELSENNRITLIIMCSQRNYLVEYLEQPIDLKDLLARRNAEMELNDKSYPGLEKGYKTLLFSQEKNGINYWWHGGKVKMMNEAKALTYDILEYFKKENISTFFNTTIYLSGKQ